MRRLGQADAMLLVATVLWSANFAMTKLAFEGGWNPLAFSAVRFAAAGLIVWLVMRLRGGGILIARRDLPLALAAAATGITLNQLAFVHAVEHTTAANVALILASSPVFAAIFATMLGDERVSRVHWLALATSVVGVALVVHGSGGTAGFSLVGDLLAVGAALTWGAYSVMLPRLTERYSVGHVSAFMVVVGGAMLVPFALPDLGSQDFGALGAEPWAAWAYAAVFPLLVTNLLFFSSLRRIGASRATLYMYLQPFLGALFAAAILGERLTLEQLLGGAVIVGGVVLGRSTALVVRRRRRAAAAAAARPESGADRPHTRGGGAPAAAPRGRP